MLFEMTFLNLVGDVDLNPIDLARAEYKKKLRGYMAILQYEVENVSLGPMTSENIKLKENLSETKKFLIALWDKLKRRRSCNDKDSIEILAKLLAKTSIFILHILNTPINNLSINQDKKNKIIASWNDVVDILEEPVGVSLKNLGIVKSFSVMKEKRTRLKVVSYQ